jgi:hypothetical protein
MASSTTKFINRFQVEKSIASDKVNQGYYGLSVGFAALTCKYEMVPAATRKDISLIINVSDDSDTSYD